MLQEGHRKKEGEKDEGIKETSKIINSYGIWGMGVCGLITLFFLF